MTIEEEPEPNPCADHVLDWLEDSASFFSSFLDDPYNAADIGSCWWDQSHDILNTSSTTTTSLYSTTCSATNNIIPPPSSPTPDDFSIITKSPPRSDSSGKRKAPDDQISHQQRKNQVVKKKMSNRKTTTGSNNSGNGNNKEGRWAEQLLNPCAIAVTAGNLSRVQHLIYVLHELASPTGDANHRLAAHGLRALTHHLSPSSPHVGPTTFATTEPRFFQLSLLKFYEVSPWFSFPNNIANSSILQILGKDLDQTQTRNQNLHILDIGVSHGVQWPTLLEALTRRSGGPPALVRITVVASTIESDQNVETPFSIGPPGDNFSSRLLAFAKSMNINLQIDRLDNQLENLNSNTIRTSSDETLIICAQFRLHHLKHHLPDERSDFLKVLRSLNPKGVILSENNMDCSCSNCVEFATGFSRRVDYLWRFLDSTSSAFKGRESEERRVMEGEASKALTNSGEMNEGKDKWCERMVGAGFVGEIFGEDVIDGARAMLRKYDNNWEMKVDEKDGCIGLWWKGQPVSFCSLWNSNVKIEKT